MMADKLFLRKIKNALRFLPDKLYIQIYYFAKFKKKCDFKQPKTFTEKLQWLKMHDRRPDYKQLVDKLLVRSYVESKIGKRYLVPLLGGPWDSFEEIPLESLPEQFVLKCTHDSGSVVLCKNKDLLDKAKAGRQLDFCLKNDYYWVSREWPYKGLKPQIIAEAFLTNANDDALDDYKVLCFHGEPKLIQIHKGRFQDHTQDYYDIQWNKLDISQGLPVSASVMEKPPFLQEMLDYSRALAKGIPHVRVDWYYAKGQLYFGELTFYDGGGFDAFVPSEYNELVGSWISVI